MNRMNIMDRTALTSTFLWAAHLLCYPDAEWQNFAQGSEGAELTASGTPPLWAHELLQYAASTPLMDMQSHFVDVFDHSAAACLYLTTHAYRDSPLQGRALAALSEIYRDSGYMFVGKELPDYLPVVLEFLSVAPPWAAACVCEKFAPVAESISGAVAGQGSPWAGLLAAVAEAMQHCSAEAGLAPSEAVHMNVLPRPVVPRELCEVTV